VDVEYNRNGIESKRVNINGTVSSRGVLPDIIVHKRVDGNIYDGEENNLLVIEMKKKTNHEVLKDHHKLKGFTSDLGVSYNGRQYIYNYTLGVFIRFGNTLEESEIIFYRAGEMDRDNIWDIWF